MYMQRGQVQYNVDKNKTTLFITSDARNSGDSNNFSIRLSKPIIGFTSFKIENVIISKQNLYNVNMINNKISWQRTLPPGPLFLGALPEGYYTTISDYATRLQTLLQTDHAGFVVTADNFTKKITISNPGIIFNLSFQVPNTFGFRIGFGYNDYTSFDSYTSPGGSILFRPSITLISSKLAAISSNNFISPSFLPSVIHKPDNAILRLHDLNSDSNFFLFSNESSSRFYYTAFSNIDSLDFSLKDFSKNEFYPLNGQEWGITLTFSNTDDIYQQPRNKLFGSKRF